MTHFLKCTSRRSTTAACHAVLSVGLALMLSACGGGSADDSQQVNGIQVRSLAYGQLATINVAGVYLRNGMTANSAACKDPVFNAARSTPELAVLNCTVIATGVQSLTINSTNGKVLYTGNITVPQPQVNVVTSQGDFIVELNPTAAPLSVNNFLTYSRTGYYNETLFHRVIPGFVAQGGGYTRGLVKKPGQLEPIALESNNGLLNTRSTLAMARTNLPNSATSEFYINLVDNPSLDFQSAANPGYAVFGRVVSGMDTLDKIAAQPTALIGGFRDVPTSDITIQLVLQIQ
jgi:cyclophilin family peptidyl-prolyl cis-trans isomerase